MRGLKLEDKKLAFHTQKNLFLVECSVHGGRHSCRDTLPLQQAGIPALAWGLCTHLLKPCDVFKEEKISWLRSQARLPSSHLAAPFWASASPVQ